MLACSHIFIAGLGLSILSSTSCSSLLFLFYVNILVLRRGGGVGWGVCCLHELTWDCLTLSYVAFYLFLSYMSWIHAGGYFCLFLAGLGLIKIVLS